MVSNVGILTVRWWVCFVGYLYEIRNLFNLEGIKMCKKSKDKRYRIVVQVAIWDAGRTRVYRYERQTVLIAAKSPQKALQKLCVQGTVLKIIAG